MSDADCKPGEEFNGGEIEISGIEFTAGVQSPIIQGINLIANSTYTYTSSSFKSTFFSGFSQWGLVKANDELPYLPEHSGQISIGFESNKWSLFSTVKFQAKMREKPGQKPIEENLHTDDYVTADITATHFYDEKLTLQLILHNATDETAIVSHRPFGARPNRPRALVGRIKYQL